jgi:AraC-like DNA-binding protein
MTTPLYDHVSFESSDISLWSHLDSPLTEEMTQKLLKPHTSNNYFLMFVNHSLVDYCVDLKDITVSAGQVLFIKPRQIRIPPSSKNKAEYYKVIFNEEIYGLLPSPCRFWLDPMNEQKVAMSTQAWQRMNDALMLLRTAILTSAPLNIRMAYLNSVLQELEHAYFSNVENEPKKRHVQSFLHFQTLIENKFVEQPTISEIAKTLALSDTSLYQLVKEWAGVSPKEYLNRRIVLEAQRLLIYSNLSVKELAVRLGFADENYLSRFFRKQTGQSITDFLVKFKDMSS